MNDKLVKHIPNIFTLIRIIFVLLAFYLLLNGYYVVSIIIIIIASITDFLDGCFARTLNAQSTLGAMLDQFADKLFEILISIGLIYSGNYFLIVTLILELLFTGLIIKKYLKTKHWSVSTKLGKIKTVLLFLTIILALMYLMFDGVNISFIVVWAITTIFQLFANINIIKEYGLKKKSVKDINKD